MVRLTRCVHAGRELGLVVASVQLDGLGPSLSRTPQSRTTAPHGRGGGYRLVSPSRSRPGTLLRVRALPLILVVIRRHCLLRSSAESNLNRKQRERAQARAHGPRDADHGRIPIAIAPAGATLARFARRSLTFERHVLIQRGDTCISPWQVRRIPESAYAGRQMLARAHVVRGLSSAGWLSIA